MVDIASGKLPAHRPSRRHVIVDAAVRVFARQGFVDASVQDVAAEAEVVPNAIYYHFAGKEELFDAALRHAMEQIDEATENARDKATARDADTFRAVTDAVWDWVEDHPDEGQLLYSHLPGATPRARALWEEFEDRHIRQALAYLEKIRGPRPGYSAAANKAAQIFTGRTFIALLIVMHPLRMQGGPLSEFPSRTLRKAVHDVALSIIAPEPPAAGEPPAPVSSLRRTTTGRRPRRKT